jgi:hypothetical protein
MRVIKERYSTGALAELTPKIAASLTGYDFILNALSVANIF